MSSLNSGFNLALLTLNLSRNDFDKMSRNTLKQYINNFIKDHANDVNLDKYKLASQLLLDNKHNSRRNNYNQGYNNQEYNNEGYNNEGYNNQRYNDYNQLGIRNFDPFFGFNNYFNSMMNEFNNFHNQFNSNFDVSEEQSNTNFDRSTQNRDVNNSSMKTYSRTYVNNNGNGYIKEESMERSKDGVPKYQSVYKKIENGKLLDRRLLDKK
jgi:hypothetical protein